MRVPVIIGLLLIMAGLAVGVFAWNEAVSVEGDVGAVERSLSTEPPPVSTSAPGPTTANAAPRPAPIPPSATTGGVRPALWTVNPSLDTRQQSVPAVLRIESLGVEAPVIATGVDDRTGDMEVPSNVKEVAWYRHGPSPGRPGSAVLAAHVDLAGQGPGVFFRLRDLEPGDSIEVEMADGRVDVFVVEARTVYAKDRLPLDTIFSRQGPPTLTLVTCGGGFDRSSQSYDSNVVVFASPATPEIPDRRE